MSRIAFALALALPLAVLAACSSTATGKTTDTSGNSAASKKKGTSAQGAGDAKSAGQKSGSTISSNKGSATDQGSQVDGVACDGDLEGTAWCADDHTAIFCEGGEWYALDCGDVGGGYCSETIDSSIVECDSETIQG